VNDTLGGPQGIQVKALVLFGWNFNSPIRLGPFTASFYSPICCWRSRCWPRASRWCGGWSARGSG